MLENASDQGSIGKVWYLIGWDGGASFLYQSNGAMKLNHCNPTFPSTLFLGGVVMDINLINLTGSLLMHRSAILKNPNQAHTYWHTLEKLTNHEQE